MVYKTDDLHRSLFLLHSPNADLPVPLGRIAIAPVLSLSKVPNDQCKKMQCLSDGPGCSVFALDSSQQFGTVCIVINAKSEEGMIALRVLSFTGLIACEMTFRKKNCIGIDKCV